MISSTEHGEDAVEGRDRKDVSSPHAQPDALEACDALFVGLHGEIDTVDRPHRRAHHEIGNHSLAGERLEHAYLYGAQAPAAGQHKRRALLATVRHGLRHSGKWSLWRREARLCVRAVAERLVPGLAATAERCPGSAIHARRAVAADKSECAFDEKGTIFAR